MRKIAVILALVLALPAFADDGELFRRNVSKTPVDFDRNPISRVKTARL